MDTCGMSSPVFLAAMIAAILAVANTSPFGYPALLDQRDRFRTHPDTSPGDCLTEGRRLGRHIHHSRLSLFVEMG